MKKTLFILALVTLASCSNETSTSSSDSACTDSVLTDSTCCDSVSIDSLANRVKLRADSVLTGIKELKK